MTDKNEEAAGSPAASNPMEQFFTNAAANEGIRVPLTAPDGTKTDQWLRVHGVDSDKFRAADARSRREASKIASIENEAERDLAMIDLTRRLTAELVFDWSFPQPCTPENVVAFFKQAPQIQEAVDFFASRRAFFAKRTSPSSAVTPATSTG